MLKANSVESEPFLDWQMSPELLARYQMIYAPNAACLSDAQCAMLAGYVRNGGKLLATHLTSVADESGPKNFGLADLLGVEFMDPEPVEIPDVYLIASRNVLLLHLLADTGDNNKHLRTREEFLT